jgi:hypothetical protein
MKVVQLAALIGGVISAADLLVARDGGSSVPFVVPSFLFTPSHATP